MKSERLRVLRAELLADRDMLDSLEEKYHLIKEKISRIDPDEFDYVAVAYTIVNLYNLMENYFFRIAKCFENAVEPTTWHRDLIRRMSLEIGGIRPAVLSVQEAASIDELRAFRHVFRHVYQSELDIDKLQLVDGRTPAAVSAFKAAHERFLTTLEELIEEVESG